MDTDLLADAIRGAIADGAVCAPPMPGARPDADINLLRSQTDIGMTPSDFEAYVERLRAIPEMAEFDSMFGSVPHGGGVSLSLPGIARLVLAQAIASGDVEATVVRFRDFVAANSAPSIAVMGVSGITLAHEISLGPRVRLVPMSSVPFSTQRGAALGQGLFPPMTNALPVSCAIIADFDYAPVFYKPSDGVDPAREARQRVYTMQLLLEEARLVLGVAGSYPLYRMFWAQVRDPLMTGGTASGWQSSPHGRLTTDAAVDVAAAEEIAARYFAIEQSLRYKFLRIPLDRLSRSVHENDLADRSIDLGIALEALLLHDAGSPQDRGELKYRLSLRGAWLAGGNAVERGEIQRSLGKLYDLRSRAAHSGTVERTDENATTILRGTELCRLLIRRVIEVGAQIDWRALVLG